MCEFTQREKPLKKLLICPAWKEALMIAFYENWENVVIAYLGNGLSGNTMKGDLKVYFQIISDKQNLLTFTITSQHLFIIAIK